MLLRDFFYFNEGEKKSLLILLVLALAAYGWMLYNDASTPATQQQEAVIIPQDTTPQNKAQQATPAAPAIASKPKAGASARPKAQTPTHISSKEFRETKSLYKKRTYTRPFKLPKGSIVELNTADTSLLKQVPGIGSVFAKRIVGFRRILGGYASVSQLQEVYGLDAERYAELKPWFKADTSLVVRLDPNVLSIDSLAKHPYINYKQARILVRLAQQKIEKLSWDNLYLLEEFSGNDRTRLQPYLKIAPASINNKE